MDKINTTPKRKKNVLLGEEEIEIKT